jgi:hypothetical protein
VAQNLIQTECAMNVNSNNNTRVREKWNEGRKHSSEKGAEREDKWWWGEWGRVIYLKTCRTEAHFAVCNCLDILSSLS